LIAGVSSQINPWLVPLDFASLKPPQLELKNFIKEFL